MLAAADEWEDEDDLRDELLDIYNEQLSPLTKKIYKLLDHGLAIAKEELLAQQKEAEEKLQLVSRLQIINVCLSVLFLVVFGFYFHRKLQTGFNSLDEALSRMAQGDFTHQIEVKGRDEIARMLLKINQTNEELRPLIEKIRGVSAELEGEARQMKGAAEETISANEETKLRAESMERGASNILANTEAETQAINEISSAIQEISQNTAKASQVTGEAVEKARLAQEVIHKVGEVSREIESVIQLINGVAEQTKFLALNATIEAARAGEAGRGFAVVAGEVKELSRNSGELASRIADTVQTLVNVTLDMRKRMDALLEAIGRTRERTMSVASAVEEQTAVIGELSGTVQDLSGGLGDLDRISGEIRERTEKSEKNTETLDSEARDLAALAEELRNLVSQYKLGKALSC